MMTDKQLWKITKHPKFWPQDVFTALGGKLPWNFNPLVVPTCVEDFNMDYGVRLTRYELQRLGELLKERAAA